MESRDAFFRAAFDAAPDGIIVFGDDGAYIYANQAAADIYELPREDLVRRRVGDFTLRADQFKLEGWFATLRERRVLEGRHRITGAQGGERFVSFRTRADFLPGRHITIVRVHGGRRLRLSRREQEVLQMLARGLNGSAIAKDLYISPETVRTHVRNAMDKLGAHTRAHAIALGVAYGEIAAD